MGNEQELRWTAAWWIGHALVGVGAAALATRLFGNKTAGLAAIVSITAHHMLDTPIALALYRSGL